MEKWTRAVYQPNLPLQEGQHVTASKEHIPPGMTVEPSLPDELVERAKAFADTAIITISRFSGEGWDRSSVEYVRRTINL